MTLDPTDRRLADLHLAWGKLHDTERGYAIACLAMAGATLAAAFARRRVEARIELVHASRRDAMTGGTFVGDPDSFVAAVRAVHQPGG